MSVFAVKQFSGGMNDWIHPELLDDKTALLSIQPKKPQHSPRAFLSILRMLDIQAKC